MTKETLYAIASTWMTGKFPCRGYLAITEKISYVTDKAEATLFKSKALAYGWMIKAKVMNRTAKFNVVTL